MTAPERDGAVGVIRRFSREELRRAGVPERLLDNPAYVPASGALDGVELFDAAFFGIPPAEAELLDPQQRLFLECAWEALEDAGHPPAAEPGRVGVFAGTGLNTYLMNLASRPEILEALGGYQVLIASDKDFLATRVSYKLGLRGPSLAVQTACSTSLVAVHLACRSLLADECELALAGGVSVSVPQASGYLYQPGMILSPDGHCRPFDAAASGTVRGSGLGVVVLRRLEDALADGDSVRAVILASGVNNDGAAKVGYTAPGVDGQAEVLAEAWARAGVEPSTLSYLEAHGTGTPLGDPIELAALKRVLGEEGGAPCALGSVKGNIGHLNTASGVAGLIKTVLCLEQAELPPSLHFETPNPALGLADSRFFVAREARPWPPEALPRRAAVSSFGIGGTNAHVVLEEAPPVEALPPPRPEQLLVLSARSEVALEAKATQLAARLREEPALELADVAFTLAVGRQRFDHRRSLVAASREEAIALLEGGGSELEELRVEDAQSRPVAFLFPGQGSQQPGMARRLHATEPVFREELERCLGALAPQLEGELRGLLLGPADDAEAARRLEQTRLAQPALFALEYALARLWWSWGVVPEALLGHSVGELVAATLAG